MAQHSQLWGVNRKSLPMERLLKILEQYQMWNIIVRDAKGVDHYLDYDMNSSIATHVKREELSQEMGDVWEEPRQGKVWPVIEEEKEEEEQDEEEGLEGERK